MQKPTTHHPSQKEVFWHNYLLFVENMPFDQSNCTQTVELSIQVFVCVDSLAVTVEVLTTLQNICEEKDDFII